MDNLIPFLIQNGYVILFIWVFAETLGLPVPANSAGSLIAASTCFAAAVGSRVQAWWTSTVFAAPWITSCWLNK